MSDYLFIFCILLLAFICVGIIVMVFNQKSEEYENKVKENKELLEKQNEKIENTTTSNDDFLNKRKKFSKRTKK